MTFRSLLVWLLIWCSVLSPVQAANLLKMGQIQAWGENHRCHYPINNTDSTGLMLDDDSWVGMTAEDRADVRRARVDTGAFVAEQVVFYYVGGWAFKGAGFVLRPVVRPFVRLESTLQAE